MRDDRLSRYFTGFAFKRLKWTEVDLETSRGHEFQGVGDIRRLLGAESGKFNATIVYLSDDEDRRPPPQNGMLSWYDSRKAQHHRAPEYRLYYEQRMTVVNEYAEAGDLLFVGKTPKGDLLVVICEAESTLEGQLLWLFGFRSEDVRERFAARFVEGESDRETSFVVRRILEVLQIDALAEPPSLAYDVTREFKDFPSTRVFSEVARGVSGVRTSLDDPDAALMSWLDTEEILFRSLEKHLVAHRLKQNFDSVDDFVAYSLQVHNRRKARAGKSLEHHVEQVFKDHAIKYVRGAVTEESSRPDFLFPSLAAYNDPAFPVACLTVLGAKTTCKDRWRQVLAEAARIQVKHLLTLEPSISEQQTNEMRGHSVQLVVPGRIHETYQQGKQREWLMTVRQFIASLRTRAGSEQRRT